MGEANGHGGRPTGHGVQTEGHLGGLGQGVELSGRTIQVADGVQGTDSGRRFALRRRNALQKMETVSMEMHSFRRFSGLFFLNPFLTAKILPK